MLLARLGSSTGRGGNSTGLTVTPSRMSRPKTEGERLLDLGAQPALELAAGELVDDLDDRLVAVQRDRRAGLSQARWLGCSSPTTRTSLHEVRCLGLPCSVAGSAARSSASSTRAPRHPSRFPSSGPVRIVRHRCHDVAYKTPHTSPQPVKEPRPIRGSPAAARADSSADIRDVSAGQRARSAGLTSGRCGRSRECRWGRRGISSGPNLTRRSPSRQDFIHRPTDPGADQSRRSPGAHGLTLWKSLAYRWPVTWCRRVPHVHA